MKVNQVNVPLRESLTESLQEVAENVRAHYAAMSDAEFIARTNDAWSPAENLDHLIKSNKPLVRAFQMPRVALHARFGTAQNPSRDLASVRAQYDAVLAGGAVAAGNYLPTPPPADAREHQRALLAEWEKCARELTDAVKTWSDRDLDQSILPHPLLGNLTMREMIFFTLYHNTRHISAGGD